MRGSAIWFCEQVADAPAGRYDVLFTCDMTSVADLRAFLPPSLKPIPIVCYFHENQLTYPLSPNDWRDYQFGFTNITSALAADQVWFNSQSHLDAFFAAVQRLLKTMPENLSSSVLPKLSKKSTVQYPAVELPSDLESFGKGSAPNVIDVPTVSPRLRILWPHRWEYDKNPKPFFDALQILCDQAADFELVILGESFRTAPPEFQAALTKLESHITHAGYLPERVDYWAVLRSCDVVVSTAIQENFGLAIVEAIIAGCVPLLPDRLSYPELLGNTPPPNCLYRSDLELPARLATLCNNHDSINQHASLPDLAKDLIRRFGSPHQIPRLDAALSDSCKAQSPSHPASFT